MKSQKFKLQLVVADGPDKGLVYDSWDLDANELNEEEDITYPPEPAKVQNIMNRYVRLVLIPRDKGELPA